jgi:glycosyltransferase involved in cell wall biosynthesis
MKEISNMKRYKVAIVSDTYLPKVGGLEVHLRDLAHELTLRGHEAHVICVTPGGPDHEIFPIHRLAVPVLPRLGRIRSAESIAVLEQFLRRGGYDIVHSHCIFSPLGHAAAYLANRLGLPSVFTLHSVLRGPVGVGLRLLDRVYPWSTWPTILTGVSSFVADELRLVSGRTDVEVLLNATRTEDWGHNRQEELRVVSVMRFTKRKRPIDLIRMVPQVLRKLPRSQWPLFTLVGDGPERKRVEREAVRLGVRQHVEFPGFQTREQIQLLLARSAVFAMPSYLEALSIAVIEARCAGLPVVARTPSGVAEVIEHGEQGYLARDNTEFVNYLVKLLANPALRAKMSATTQLNLDRFTWPRAIERHERIYALATERFHQRLHPRPRSPSAALKVGASGGEPVRT